MLKMILIFHIQLCLKMDFPYELIVSVVLAPPGVRSFVLELSSWFCCQGDRSNKLKRAPSWRKKFRTKDYTSGRGKEGKLLLGAADDSAENDLSISAPSSSVASSSADATWLWADS